MAKVKLFISFFINEMTFHRTLRTYVVEYFDYLFLKKNRVLTFSFKRDEVDHHVVVEKETDSDSVITPGRR